MGGRAQSGLGRRHGADGLLRFTESQTIAEQRVGLGPLYALGGRRVAASLTGALRAARRMRLPWP
jgi:succinate-semialdehyde dehydrogenase / glutarate-semialdehyde dehydrogenase